MSGRPFLALAAILVIGLGFAGCQRDTEHGACPAGQRCLRYGNGADPTSLNPQLATAVNEAAILRELFEGLYADGPDGRPVFGLADSAATSPDGLTWTFHLRPARWSDGAPVTANDFVFAYRHMLDPKTGSSYAYLLYVLKNGQAVNAGGQAAPQTIGARALGDHTLQLTLAHPAAYLPELLKHQAFYPIPEHLVRRVGDKWVQPGVMVSDGPYRLVEWRLSDYVAIEKNPFYRDADKVCFDRVIFYPIGDAISAERRALRGELDLTSGIQSNRLARLRNRPESAPYVHSHTYLAVSYLIFNRRDVAPLKDVRVRQAISMAVDRAFVTDKLLRAGQTPTTAFVPPGIAGYLPPGVSHPHAYWADWPLEERLAEARRLLAAAGYGPQRPLKLELKTFNAAGSLLVAESIQADLKSVGIDISFRQEDGIVALQSFEIRDFQIGTVSWVADFDDPMTFLGLMKSDTGAQNYGDYQNPAYDALLSKADDEPDGAVRARYLAQAEQMMLDDADVAPLYVAVNLNLVDPRITGWVDNDEDVHPIRYLCRNAAPPDATKPRA